MTVFFAHFIVPFLSEQSKRLKTNFKPWRNYLRTFPDEFGISETHPFFAIEAPNLTIFRKFRDFRNYELLILYQQTQMNSGKLAGSVIINLRPSVPISGSSLFQYWAGKPPEPRFCNVTIIS